MNTYVISPKLVRIKLDKTLSDNFSSLNKRLQWRPLTINLDSCEEAPYLYFRIALKLRQGSPTYAGFSTGAPFMLTRDVDVKKRAFFLRHWVRRDEEQHKTRTNIPLVPQQHMSIGAHEETLLVRVNIDRTLDKNDTFKSIPFATMMFQVVQVDAIIDDLPNLRLAFAIERTVTPEERDTLCLDSKNIKTPAITKGPVSKADQNTRATRKNSLTPLATAVSTGTNTNTIKQKQHKQKTNATRASAVMANRKSTQPAVLNVPEQQQQQQQQARLFHPTPVQAPAMQQSLLYRSLPINNASAVNTTTANVTTIPTTSPTPQSIRPTTVSPRAPASMYQHNPYNFTPVNQRQVPMQMRQAVGVRPATMPQPNQQIPIPTTTKTVTTPQTQTNQQAIRPSTNRLVHQKATSITPSSKPISRTMNFSSTTKNAPTKLTHTSTPTTATISNPNLIPKFPLPMTPGTPHYRGVTENVKSNAHPDIRLWEAHDANDPYEPLFVTDDAKFEEKLKKRVILDHASERRDRFDHNELFGFCASDFPEFYISGPDVNIEGDQQDMNVPVKTIPRDKLNAGSVPVNRMNNAIKGSDYDAVIIAASTYNSNLGRERHDLRQWIVEDAERQEARSEEENGEDDVDSTSE